MLMKLFSGKKLGYKWLILLENLFLIFELQKLQLQSIMGGTAGFVSLLPE